VPKGGEHAGKHGEKPPAVSWMGGQGVEPAGMQMEGSNYKEPSVKDEEGKYNFTLGEETSERKREHRGGEGGKKVSER